MKKVYYTHDNGARPFKVLFDIKNKQCMVFKELDFDQYETTPIKTFKYEKVFIGKSPLNPMTKFSGGHGPKFDGNSILLHIKDHLYVFIGESIFQFHSDTIKKFTSPVGNSDIPYPYAITDMGDIHLFLEGVTIHKKKEYGKITELNKLFQNLKIDVKDPYMYYYAPSHIKLKIKQNPNLLSQSEYKVFLTQYNKTIKKTKLKGKKILVKRLI